MKTFTSVLLFLAASASMVAAAPGPLVTPAPLYPRQNAAGNDGSKGIEAADIAQEAVDLANAGDSKTSLSLPSCYGHALLPPVFGLT